jgi:hypothetical protein
VAEVIFHQIDFDFLQPRVPDQRRLQQNQKPILANSCELICARLAHQKYAYNR